MTSAIGDRMRTLALEAIADCNGARLVESALAREPGPFLVLGAGKAAGAMAAGAVAALGDGAVVGPLVAKAVEPGLPPAVSRALRLGGHPLPDERSVAAAEALLGALARSRRDLPVLFLLSGGATALVGAPLPGLSLAELASVNQRLLASGAPIEAMNAVRRRLGRAAGGRLALEAAGRRVLVLLLSDVVGDDPARVGSGPFAGDPSSPAEALAVLRAGGAAGGAAERLLEAELAGVPGMATPRPGDARLALVEHRVLAGPRFLLERAAARAGTHGLVPRAAPQPVVGDVADVAARYAAQALRVRPGEVVVAVGEPTLQLPERPGVGGRAQQLALDVALRLAQAGPAARGVCFCAVGSDGSDGPTDAAGALVDQRTADRARSLGLDAKAALERRDAGAVLDALGALVRTGPTGTNLLDLHLLARAPS